MTVYLVLFLSMTLSIMCISYKSFALQKKWPIGNILLKDASFPIIASVVTGLWVLYKSYVLLQWWTPIVILIGSLIAAFILTMILRKHAQIVCILGILPALIATALI